MLHNKIVGDMTETNDKKREKARKRLKEIDSEIKMNMLKLERLHSEKDKLELEKDKLETTNTNDENVGGNAS